MKSTLEAQVEKSSSKIINPENQGEVKQWQPPEMIRSASDVSVLEARGSMLTAEQLGHVQDQAYQEGFEQGKKDGFKFGHEEALVETRNLLNEKAEKLDQLLSTLDTPLKELDEQVERELISLTISMVRQLVRREVKADPGQIVGVVRESLSLLPVSSRNIRLILHPDDAKMVREIFEVSDKDLVWEIVEDPVLGRGGCKIIADTSQIDATLESRLSAMITTLLGGERDRDEAEEEGQQ
ncbi:MAG: flagellar assembly protein FliH [Gammaproteobacteria bacterium]|nr:flagellar assembly protein FliH [Gammaproteobacteria bacterium]